MISGARSFSLLFWRTASNQDRSLIYLWHMVLGQQRHLALATFEGRVDLTHYKKPPPVTPTTLCLPSVKNSSELSPRLPVYGPFFHQG